MTLLNTHCVLICQNSFLCLGNSPDMAYNEHPLTSRGKMRFSSFVSLFFYFHLTLCGELTKDKTE